jgi:pectin methylesterase-like acyl-CoA thioesterase
MEIPMQTSFIRHRTIARLLTASALLALASANALAATISPTSTGEYCPDTPVRLTFDAPPALGTGTIQLLDVQTNTPVESIDVAKPTLAHAIGGLSNVNYYPVLIDGNTAEIHFSKPLDYGKKYSVIIPDGAITAAGKPLSFSPILFSTRAAPPAAGATKLTVDSLGHAPSADFATLQAALDFIPAGNKAPTTILLKNGTYHEIIHFTNKHNIAIVGQDRKKTILAYPNNNKFNSDTSGGLYRRGMLLAQRCNDITLANMTFHNTTPRGGTQAESIILNGTATSRAIVANCDLISFQDTLQINGQGFVSNCYIEGDVDFMWGNGPVFFENCTCTTTRSKAYYTQIRNRPDKRGYIYYHCTFNGAPGIVDEFLARIDPRTFPASEVVLIDCTLTNAVNPVGWKLDNATEAPSVHFWEFNSHDPDGKPVDTSKRLPASRQLKQPEDAQIIANYSNPTWVLGDNWTPKLPAEVADQSPRPATQPPQ